MVTTIKPSIPHIRLRATTTACPPNPAPEGHHNARPSRIDEPRLIRAAKAEPPGLRRAALPDPRPSAAKPNRFAEPARLEGSEPTD
ncbi:hypothetical protein [Amycolatopsis sulphurea]|uniref:hypothetical protein n=1 Tax=Amycolatopsis sulphurea TaxID=76022 RepID=UPI000BF95216|nr:hypothetical protein [Amycolatopsis sulphurea]